MTKRPPRPSLLLPDPAARRNRFLQWFRIVAVTAAVALMVRFAFAQQTGTDGDDQAVASEATEVETETAAEDEAAPQTWDEMSLEERVELLAASSLVIDDEGTVSASVYSDSDILWTCIAAFLVFFMQAGFAMVETGFTRAKSCVNILMKNLMDFSIGSLAFWAVGFGLMFGASSGWFGMSDFFVSGIDPETGEVSHWNMAFWIFQVVFAATAATIVSGAMAERTKFRAYLFYTVFITAVVYPIFGSWAWGSLHNGGGWLEGLGFMDFAGSTVVHSVGGWAALAGAIVLGPRKGRYGPGGKVNAIPGHSMPLAALGVFILWLGWFGFNPGSTTAIGGGEFARVAVTTNLAAAAGAVGAMICSWLKFGKPDVGLSLNGALAGLVAITAPCYFVGPGSAILIGFLAGPLCVLSVLLFDRIRVDDPVGAISVHGVCGAWGTLATGLFASEVYGGTNGLLFGGEFGVVLVQLIGIGACFAWTFTTSFVLFKVINATVGLRVSEEEEVEGLDLTEHGASAYPNFQVVDSLPGSPVGSPAMQPAVSRVPAGRVAPESGSA